MFQGERPCVPASSPSRIIDLHEFVSWAHKCDQAIRSTWCWKEERSPRLPLRVLWKCHFPSGSHLQAAAAAVAAAAEREKKGCQLAGGGKQREEMAETQTWLNEKSVLVVENTKRGGAEALKEMKEEWWCVWRDARGLIYWLNIHLDSFKNMPLLSCEGDQKSSLATNLTSTVISKVNQTGHVSCMF